ncbi:hypothetical protein D1007_39717 [Hordeum vulgare]|nr:hypothetical protein D1007_39717 [Hordeum vulgare]
MVEVDLAGGAVGVEQRLLFGHAHFRHDWQDGDAYKHAGGEQILRTLVLLKEAEVVGLVDLRLSEHGLLLLQQHIRVLHMSLADGEANMHRRGGWHRLVLGRILNCDVVLHMCVILSAGSNGCHLLLLMFK